MPNQDPTEATALRRAAEAVDERLDTVARLLSNLDDDDVTGGFSRIVVTIAAGSETLRDDDARRAAETIVKLGRKVNVFLAVVLQEEAGASLEHYGNSDVLREGAAMHRKILEGSTIA